jgi:hypothetical protein
VRAPKTIVAGMALTAIIGVSVAACGSSKTTTTASPSATPSPLVSAATLSGVHTQVALAPSFLTAITSLGLKPGTFGTATLTGTTLAFPITGGNVLYYKPGSVTPYVQGIIHHQGSGITLTAGSTVVTLENFDVNPGTSMLTGDVLLNGKSAATGAPLFFLDGSTLQPATMDSAGDYVLTGTQVKVTPTAAGLLNKVFNTTKVPNYLLVGTATITIK